MILRKDAVSIHLDLDDVEAWELAQLCKRIGYGDFRRLSVDETDAAVMCNAMIRLRRALNAAGYDPR